MHNFSDATRFIQQADRFLVLSHLHPDGDAIGSTLAMGHLLRSLGKEVVMVNESPVPQKFRFLPETREILMPQEVSEKFHHVIALDAADRERMGTCRELFADGVQILNIDHHATNDLYGTINVVMPTAAATVEILFDWIEFMQCKVDLSLASYIYMGLLTDTGGFRYSNTTPKVLRQAARLVELGVKSHEIADIVLETTTIGQLNLLQKALSTLQLAQDGSIAWMVLKRNDIEPDQEVEGIVNYARNIEGVDVGILFREIDEQTVKVSLRSRKKTDVGQLAKSFGGGGHARAAGCTIHASLEEAQKSVLSRLQAKREFEEA
ncbi:DHH family phosphoesterase [Thermoflavimicrobium dichotomicum]|uniref:Phosphoesterase RecJ domain-containing protein n=1 Tax=Thermoflavimicrobium dichotomicum TaxID=46223 RepID=A0A1I3PNR8_9BACL|nr:bifunctional oligoribonuclease/PAP phosphatase NrnA [Thermoflavimicrobium dichotomicum]SFJ23404.1 phosphoesterase RecJ domain-containing protein [Thermoflavimicrobium dichotomicum]